jgi:hypothetical protein
MAAAEAATPLPPPSRHPLVAKILAGDAQKAIRLTAARGNLPLPLQDLLYIQICLLKDADAEVVQEATTNLEKTQVETLAPLFRDSKCDPILLGSPIRPPPIRPWSTSPRRERRRPSI